MDTDPLADSLPPRYAIESDDEDEFNPLIQDGRPHPEPEIQVIITGNIPTNVNLIIASGIAGKTWARGADLKEQSGVVSVNGVKIALVYNPPWTTSNIIISEVFSELPLHAMHPYAESILDSLNPKSVSLLDSYPVPTYVTAHPVPFHETPIRYLSTSQPNFLDNKPELFKPPNLIQATSASFLSILSLRGIPGTLILLPCPFISPSRPKQISPSEIPRLNEDKIEWSPTVMKSAQSLLFQALEEPIHNVWEYVDPHQDKSTKHRSQVGDSGMYM